MSPPVTQVFTF